MNNNQKTIKILLVYPQYPDTFWGFKHALKFVSKKAAFPPLGLLTIASMLPETWKKKLIDLNIRTLSDRDIKWADYVFISAMAVQRESAQKLIKRLKELDAKIVAGGPLFTSEHYEFEGINHFVLNEAEITLPMFLDDLKNDRPRHIYTSVERPDIEVTPIPTWSLINNKNYNCMCIQYSRGCPFDCEFCDIVSLNGRIPRTKSADQFIRELEAIYLQGWRGSVFIVDDNFIGNRKKLKAEILPAVIEWMKTRNFPFTFFTEASINLADDDELMDLMIKANFNMVFVGIETTNAESLAECGKLQNKNRDMAQAIKRLQNHGLQVQGGFIVGFDNDPQAIFDNLINFIQKTGIVTAMVGLLKAPPGTRLYQRLMKENRITHIFSGNNTDCSINFIPKMHMDTLVEGYIKIVKTIYEPKQYYERIKTFLKAYQPNETKRGALKIRDVAAFIKSIWFLGMREKGKRYYWKLITWALLKCPRNFHISITLSIYGYHFRKIAKSYINSLNVNPQNVT